MTKCFSIKSSLSQQPPCGQWLSLAKNILKN